jgi:hypothetical protein
LQIEVAAPSGATVSNGGTTVTNGETIGETKGETNMLKFPLTLVVVPGLFLNLVTGTIAQTAPPNLPVAVICYSDLDHSWRVGYLSRINENGDADYSSANGNLGITVNAKGVVLAPTNRTAATDCIGKTIDELRGDGRVLDFQRTR